ncbi:MAG: SRPBCC domain-containing protein [Betaproteobacteria bacterium]|nr:SRPBCC domain-containing protein [Betaproteobacteria bacterium]
MSAPAIAGDQATVTVTVAVPPAEAFRLFTEDIDLWWRRGPRFRSAPSSAPGSEATGGIMHIEPGLGGRVFESYDTGDGERVIEIGRALAWDPPRRLLFEWRLSNFAAAERTEVEVTFQASPSGTRVTVVHRGWAALRRDHPARHGLAGAEFVRTIGLWWGQQMSALRAAPGA